MPALPVLIIRGLLNAYSGYMVSKGLSLDVDSLANINACSLVSQIQKDMQDLCNNATDRIFGAKESNFIKF